MSLELPAVLGAPIAALDTAQLIALAAALGWASGMRLYAVLFFTGLAGRLGWLPLPEGLQLLQQPLVLGLSGLALAVEFFADKIPGLDSVWDALHTVLRIPAGAALAAGVFGGDQAAWALGAAILGGSLATTAHLAKATTRAAVNTSPEPFSNIALSLAGDALVPALLWLAVAHPLAFGAVLAVLVVLAIVLTVLLFRFLRALAARLRRRFGGGPAPA